jgi:hypothetical protein
MLARIKEIVDSTGRRATFLLTGSTSVDLPTMGATRIVA